MAQTHILERLENLTAALQDALEHSDGTYTAPTPRRRDAEHVACIAAIDNAVGIAGEIRTMIVGRDAGQLIADEFGAGGRAEQAEQARTRIDIIEQIGEGWPAVAEDLRGGMPAAKVAQRVEETILEDDTRDALVRKIEQLGALE